MSFDLRTAGVKPKLELSGDLPRLRVDGVQIQQVLVNVLRNAVDSMAEMPQTERRLEISTTPDGEGGVMVSVPDAGCGVPEEIAPRIFDSFFTTKPQGMGMGLALCRTIIEDHGGSIAFRPNPSGGSTFSFRLRPARRHPEQSRSPAPMAVAVEMHGTKPPATKAAR